MEPPSKRPRFSDNADTDDFDLGEARARNNLKLKSRFEGIFEKYGKDFSSMGDEIDLKTGAIVVNNGHLEEMQNEQDIGRGVDGPDPDDNPDSFGEPEFDWITTNEAPGDIEPPLLTDDLGGHEGGDVDHPPLPAEYSSNIQQTHLNTLTDRPVFRDGDSEADDPLSNHFSVNPAPGRAGNLEEDPSQSNHEFPNGSKSSKMFEKQAGSGMKETPATNKNAQTIPPIDPLWQTPEIEGLVPNRVSKSAPMYTPPDRALSVSPSNGKSLWAGPWTRVPRKDKGVKKGPRKGQLSQTKRKLFSTPELQALRKFKFANVGAESDDSDDPLQDDSYETPIKRPSPGATELANGSSTPSGSNNVDKKFCKFCRRYFSEVQFRDHVATVLSRDNYDGIHDLEEMKKLQDIRLKSSPTSSREEQQNGESDILSSEVTMSTPIPVSKTPIVPRLPSYQHSSPPKANPLHQKDNGIQEPQGKPNENNDSNNLDPDPFADDDFGQFSPASGLSSIQIEPSPIKTPRKRQSASSPFSMRSSTRKEGNEERFSLLSKRPIKIPIFKRTKDGTPR